jgi:hypothetical protein
MVCAQAARRTPFAFEKLRGKLGDEDGRAALLPAARKGDTVASLGLGQCCGTHEEVNANAVCVKRNQG